MYQHCLLLNCFSQIILNIVLRITNKKKTGGRNIMIKFVDTSSLLPEPVLEACMHEAGLDTLHQPHHLVLHNVLLSITAFCLLKTFLNDGFFFSQHLNTEWV
jgi:hypothetical protein